MRAWEPKTQKSQQRASGETTTKRRHLSRRSRPAPFSIHVEDYNLGSLNSLHAGAPKVWLIIEPSATHLIEQLLHAYADKLWGQKWDLPVRIHR
jgi:hypothetical protein